MKARIKPIDIDMVSPGQAARLRIVALDSRRTPEIAARVAVVAAEVSVDPATQERYYLAKIRIPGSELRLLNTPLLPGMPVEAHVTTAERTALDYLLKPLLDELARAMKED